MVNYELSKVKAKETRTLLVAQMKRVIELLEDDNNLLPYSYKGAEVTKKLHEIRRDSIRLAKEMYPN